ncbi:MAG: MBG domain-containing protein [Christensenellales bacterium]
MQKNKYKLSYIFLGVVMSLAFLLCGVSLRNDNSVEAQVAVYPLAQTETLPESYSLYNISGITVEQNEGLSYRVGNQSGSNICWTFASLTAFETTLKMTNLIDKNENINFSEADMAYYVHKEARDRASVGGGATEFAYEYLSRGVGVAQEQSWETYSQAKNWANDATLTTYYESKIATEGRTYLPYEAKEYKLFPSRSAIKFNDSVDGVDSDTTEQKVLELRNSIKQHITTYGAVMASIYMNNSYYNNTLYTYCNNDYSTTNHMIAIVGWDDNKEDNLGNKGAYICQNSYGSTYGNGGFFYVMYNDNTIEDDVGGFVRVGEVENVEDILLYDKMDVEGAVNKNQFVVLNGTTYSTEFYNNNNTLIFANIFERQNYSDQYISKIKLPTISVLAGTVSNNAITYYTSNNSPTNFKVFVADGISKSDLTSLSTVFKNKFSTSTAIKNPYSTGGDEYLFTSQQTGFYCVDLQEEVAISGDYFVVFMMVQKDGYVFAGNNSSNISYPTYMTSNSSGTSGWGEYKIGSGSSAYNSVFPMIVEGKVKGEIQTSLQESSIVAEYDGKAHNPKVVVSSPDNAEISYSIDGGEYVSDINLVDVKWGEDANGNKVVLPYTITIKVSAKFYQSKTLTCYVQINPKTLNVIPIEQTIAYGELDNQTLTFSVTGLVDGEEEYHTGRLQRQPGSDAGEYPILIGDLKFVERGKFKPSNYSINFDGTKLFTILPKVLTVRPNDARKNYGDDDPIFDYTFEGAVGDEVPVGNIVLERESGENVGSYALSLSSTSSLSNHTQSGFYARNYTLQIAPDSFFVIEQRELILTFTKQLSKKAGESDPVLEFEFENTIAGEEPSYSGSLARESGENVGHYQITAGSFCLIDNESGNFLASNYSFRLEEGYLYITNGTLDASSFVSSKSSTYNGQMQYVDVYAGDSMTVLYCEGETFVEGNSQSEPIGKIHVGKTMITIKFSMQNYDDTYATVFLEILPASIIITPKSGQSAVYGETNYTIQYTYSGNIAGETPNFSGSLTREAGIDVGLYDITQGSLSLADSSSLQKDDYELVLTTGVKFEIVKKQLVVVPTDNLQKMYGKTDPELTFTLSGVVGNDAVTFHGQIVRKTGESVGSYRYELGSVTLDDEWATNYAISSSIDGTFEIVCAVIKIKIKDQTSLYGNINTNYQYEFLDGTESNIYASDSSQSVIEFVCNDDTGKPISNTTRRNDAGYDITAKSKNPNYTVQAISAKHYIQYKTCVVTFEYIGQIATVEVEQFSRLSAVPEDINTAVPGYRFGNWQIGSVVYDITNYEVQDDVTFVGSYTLITYTITYNLNGGELSGEPIKTYFVTTETFYLPNPTREKYIFEGWFSSSTFAGQRIEKIEQGSTQNIILFAKWRGEDCSITVPVDNEEFAVSSEKSTVEYGSNYTFSIELQSGYSKSQNTIKTYVKWLSSGVRELIEIADIQQEDVGDMPLDPKLTIDYQIQVKGSFEIEVEGVEINVYKIIFVVDGEIYRTKEVSHGDSLPDSLIPTIPEKAHYTQIEPVWSQTNIVNAYCDLNINAIYTPDIYKVTFVFEDGQTVEQDVTYGTICSTEKLSEIYELKFLEYYEFDGQLDNIQEDTTIKVKVASNRHLLFIALGVMAGIAIVGTVVGIIVRKKRHKFNWWSYNK